MINIENKKDCSGCSACYSICPSNAIELVDDEIGFKYPKVNSDKCVNCGLCEKVCPIKKKENIDKKTKAYAVVNKNEEIRRKSSSGGIFTLLAEEIIKNNGVVFGVRFDEHFNVIHSYTETLEALKDFRGSKYVQSVIGDSYKKAKEFLEKGRLVLFTGTPCQIEGLKSFLQKDYKNLYTQDLICHGVPSPKVWRKYMEFRRKKDSNEPIEINFRNKDNGWKRFNIKFDYQTTEYKNSLDKDIYMNVFLKDVCLRDSCYDCNFKKFNRNSDITLADFWGINNINPNFDDDKGTSLVIINSVKGTDLFEKIKNQIIYEETRLEEAIKYNSAMIKSVSQNKSREDFFKDLDKLEFDVLVKKYIKNTNIFVRFLKKIKNKIIGKNIK